MVEMGNGKRQTGTENWEFRTLQLWNKTNFTLGWRFGFALMTAARANEKYFWMEKKLEYHLCNSDNKLSARTVCIYMIWWWNSSFIEFIFCAVISQWSAATVHWVNSELLLLTLLQYLVSLCCYFFLLLNLSMYRIPLETPAKAIKKWFCLVRLQ